MSCGEIYEYPNCEYDDCYCKRHWPNRSGGDELLVVNEQGDIVVYCETAINNDDDVSYKCSYCDRWMIGYGFKIDSEHRYCAHCTGKMNLREYFLSVFNDDCSVFTILPHETDAFIKTDTTTEQCEKCDKTHMIFAEHWTLERVQKFCSERAQQILQNVVASKVFLQKATQIKEYFRNYFEQRFQRKTEERARKQQEQARFEEDCKIVRKRLLTDIFPPLAQLSDADFAEKVPDSVARISTQLEHDCAKRICNRNRDDGNALSLDDTLALLVLFS